MALVEQHDADAERRERLHALARRRGQQVAQLDAGVLAARDLALERCADPGQLARAALGCGALERLALALDLLARHAGRGGPLVRPARVGEPAEHDLRVLELAQRLIGEARDRPEHVGARELRGRTRELADGARPLLLDALVGREHERALTDAPDQLHAQQGLPGARRRDDVRARAPVLAVGLERRQRGALVGPPLAAEREALEASAHRRVQVVREALFREVVEREADALHAARVGEHGVRGVLEPVALRLDGERLPDRLELGAAAEQEVHPARHVLLEQERLRALRIVVGGVDGDADDADVAPEVVERAADRLHLRRARVPAGRVDERVDDGFAAQRLARDGLAVLVGQRELRHGLALGAQRARPAGVSGRHALAAALGEQHAGHRGHGAEGQGNERESEPCRQHGVKASLGPTRWGGRASAAAGARRARCSGTRSGRGPRSPRRARCSPGS